MNFFPTERKSYSWKFCWKILSRDFNILNQSSNIPKIFFDNVPIFYDESIDLQNLSLLLKSSREAIYYKTLHLVIHVRYKKFKEMHLMTVYIQQLSGELRQNINSGSLNSFSLSIRCHQISCIRCTSWSRVQAVSNARMLNDFVGRGRAASQGW